MRTIKEARELFDIISEGCNIQSSRKGLQKLISHLRAICEVVYDEAPSVGGYFVYATIKYYFREHSIISNDYLWIDKEMNHIEEILMEFEEIIPENAGKPWSKNRQEYANKPHLLHILEIMCEFVGEDFDTFDFSHQQWYWKHSWTPELEQVFKEWLIGYLCSSKEARYEILHFPNNTNVKTVIKAVDAFIFNYGWKTES
jgi:hypothetical protein